MHLSFIYCYKICEHINQSICDVSFITVFFYLLNDPIRSQTIASLSILFLKLFLMYLNNNFIQHCVFFLKLRNGALLIVNINTLQVTSDLTS